MEDYRFFMKAFMPKKIDDCRVSFSYPPQDHHASRPSAISCGYAIDNCHFHSRHLHNFPYYPDCRPSPYPNPKCYRGKFVVNAFPSPNSAIQIPNGRELLAIPRTSSSAFSLVNRPALPHREELPCSCRIEPKKVTTFIESEKIISDEFPQDLRLPSSQRFFENTHEKKCPQHIANVASNYDITKLFPEPKSYMNSHEYCAKGLEASYCDNSYYATLNKTNQCCANSSLLIQKPMAIIPLRNSPTRERNGTQKMHLIDSKQYSRTEEMSPQYTSHALSASEKSLPWMIEPGGSISPKPNSTSKNENYLRIDKQRGERQDYNRKDIEEWSFFDVGHFLIDACKYLKIDYDVVNFAEMSNKTGDTLLQMTPTEFESFAPQYGSVFYDHFQCYKNRKYCKNESNNSNSNDRLPQTSPQFHIMQPIPFGEELSPCYVPQGYSFPTSSTVTVSYDSPLPIDSDIYSKEKKKSKSSPIQEDDISSDKPKKRGPGRPPKPENERKRKEKKTGRLWEFIRNLLLDPSTCPSLIRWENHEEGVFRFVQSEKIAEMWGMRKNNTKMNYEKLSRAMRYYYKGQIFEPVLGKRLVYKFGPRARAWRPLNPILYSNIMTPTTETL